MYLRVYIEDELGLVCTWGVLAVRCTDAGVWTGHWGSYSYK